MTNTLNPVERTSQRILNQTTDTDFDLIVTEQAEFDGTAMKRKQSPLQATKITVTGTAPLTITYVAKAPIGTAQATAKWQCKKIDQSVAGTTTITWASGGAFNQVATDLTTLIYA